jgi:hypothetical protein
LILAGVRTVNTLFKNAIESLQLGIEDYQANDPKRALSAVRNFYAGTLLRAKEVLVRAAPKADQKAVIGAKYKPVPDGSGGIKLVPSDRTIDFNEIGERFAAFDLKIDNGALRDLTRIRNQIEHHCTDATHDRVREAIAKAFPVVADLFRLANEDPLSALGDCWPTMLLVKEMYDRELAECKKSFEGVKWESESMSEAAIICPECHSHLVGRKQLTNPHPEDADGLCRSCGEEINAQKIIETALGAHFGIECHVAVKDGGEPPISTCPDCSAEAYVIWEGENGCAWCGFSLEGECARCGTTLEPNNVSDDDLSLCSYCGYVMSKDD